MEYACECWQLKASQHCISTLTRVFSPKLIEEYEMEGICVNESVQEHGRESCFEFCQSETECESESEREMKAKKHVEWNRNAFVINA